MTLPWKVLVLSLLGLVAVQAYEIDYLAEWLYSRSDMAGVPWAESGAARSLLQTRFMAYAAFGVANVAAIVAHGVATRLGAAAPDRPAA